MKTKSPFAIGLLTMFVGLCMSISVNKNVDAQNSYARDPIPYQSQAPIRAYDFVYYPSHQVYFSPRTRLWFWNVGGSWRSDYAPPYRFNLDFRLAGIPISLRSRVPYYEHVFVDQYYGRPWKFNHYETHRNREDGGNRHWRKHHRYHNW